MANVIDPRQVRIDWDASGNPIYVGLAASYDTATSDLAWDIWKLNFDANGQFIDGKARVLDWDNRTVGW